MAISFFEMFRYSLFNKPFPFRGKWKGDAK